MSGEKKQLAIIASICFFPTAIAGWMLHSKSEAQALRLFRLSIYIFLFMVLVAGIIVVTNGGKIIQPMGSFF